MAERRDPRGSGTLSNSPLVDLIFPNRPAAGSTDEAWLGGVTRAADRARRQDTGQHGTGQHGTGQQDTWQHGTGQQDTWRRDTWRQRTAPYRTGKSGAPRRISQRVDRALRRLFRRRTKVIQVVSGRTGRRRLLADMPVDRRRLMLGLGTGVIVAGGVGTAAALLGGGGSANRPRTADGLGAAGLAESPAAAARIAAGATPTFPSPLERDPELHLLRRTTFGPTLVEVVAAKQMGIDAWLERQFTPAAINDPLADQILALYPTTGLTIEQIRATLKDGDYQAMRELGRATLARQMWSTRQLLEVMVDFWSNHLNVTNLAGDAWDNRTDYDNTVIRGHALGRFMDLLVASARSPAMLRYLDNARSEKRSVNENYGRELLELHTVGLDAKYTEADVRNSAYIMTGRTVDDKGQFRYDARRHWTGPVKVLDFSHPNSDANEGLEVGEAYLRYLGTHPSTARRIAFKLARRFVCDDPPQTLVDRLAQSYLDNDTAIVPMLRTLFSSVEFWMSTGLKVRTPLENVVATVRTIAVTPGAKTADGIDALYYLVERLGQAPLTWGPPDGFPDVAEAWASAHATLGTWNSHRTLVLGGARGLTYPKPETFVGLEPVTVGGYLDTVSLRLVHQTMRPEHKAALLAYLGAEQNTPATDVRLGGKVDYLIPLFFDSVYHALR